VSGEGIAVPGVASEMKRNRYSSAGLQPLQPSVRRLTQSRFA